MQTTASVTLTIQGETYLIAAKSSENGNSVEITHNGELISAEEAQNVVDFLEYKEELDKENLSQSVVQKLSPIEGFAYWSFQQIAENENG